MSENVTYQKVSEDYAEIRLNRPEKHNAISTEMAEELLEMLEQAKQESIKFLVLTGTGDGMFCAGGDLSELHGRLTMEEAYALLHPMKQVLYKIISFPVPVICLLNGNAVGGGCEIATACDIRIAKETSAFGFVQSTLGILPGWGGGAVLYEKVLPSFAFQWLTEGSIYSAVDLRERGWLHHLVSEQDWHNQEDVLHPYITKSLGQMKLLKSQYKKKLCSRELSSLMNEEVQNSSSLWDSPEHVAAVERFESRKRG
ncbi:enoyl-CoA hydratase/isomerase family protein [Virgibacillus xinjiangensis]|uniref:Enoyl-CoA hydratase/isomerase family protein n=1 Tax=Virgibacillus xinjiangensis TaxID=393090 RepID=A0ABV7CV56_9BACI